MRGSVIIGLVILAVGSAFAQLKGLSETSIRKTPRPYLEKLDSVPDLTQTDPNGRLPGGGVFYCASVAVSNSMAWFSDNGFDKLMPAWQNRKKAQFEVARILGTKRYMNTSLKTGTDAEGVIKGVSRYLVDRGYKYFELEYQGWCRHPFLFGTGVDVPQPNWIKQGLLGDSAVWLNAGWYRYIPSTNQFYRFGEHWLTLVGYGVDKQGNNDESILIIHDPAPRAGKEPAHTYIKLQMIQRGRLVGKMSGLPRSAKGYYLLTGEMRVHGRADFAILDGAVVLKLKKTKR